MRDRETLEVSNGHTVGLAGDFMVLEEDPATGSSSVRYDTKGLGRTCGSCTLCCKLVSIMQEDWEKPAGKRCEHCRTGHGCRIYKARPFACRSWSCRWMADPRAHSLPRPDHAHYVVDSIIDYVTVQSRETGETMKVSVLQVWVDPAFPDAHEDPRLRAYLVMMAETFRCAALIRYDASRGFVLAAPSLCEGGVWQASDVSAVGSDHWSRQDKPRPQVSFAP